MSKARSGTLVIRPEKLGDLIVSIPAIHALKEAYPNEPLHVLTDDQFESILAYDPHIDRVLPIHWKRRTWPNRDSLSKIRENISHTQYARAAILYANCDLWNWLAWTTSIPRVAQLGGTIPALFFGHQIVRRSGYTDAPMHYRDWYLKVAIALGAKDQTKNPEVYLTQNELYDFKSRFRRFSNSSKRIIVHLGASPEGENYSYEALSSLTLLLAESFNLSIFVTGTGHDKRHWRNLNPALVVVDLLASLSLREMMAALSLANVVVSNSTGVAHLAAALGVPIVGLYGCQIGNDKYTWGPLARSSIVLSPKPHEYKNASKDSRTRSLPLENFIPQNDIVKAIAALI